MLLGYFGNCSRLGISSKLFDCVGWWFKERLQSAGLPGRYIPRNLPQVPPWGACKVESS